MNESSTTLRQRSLDSKSAAELTQLIQNFAGMINKTTGAHVQPWGTSFSSKLELMPEESKTLIRAQLKFHMNVINEFEIDPKEIDPTLDHDKMEERLLEVCARKLGLVFNPEVYQTLTKDKIVEIYNMDLIQIYRSLNFFNLCSYNLFELLTHEWTELYERSIQVNNLLFEAGTKLTGRPYSLEPVSLRHIPRHIMREKKSEQKVAFSQQFEEMYPIYTWSREFYGYLIILKAERVPEAEANLSFI